MTRVSVESGFVAGLEALAFGVLVFVVGTLVMVNGWAVVDASFAASAAAREAVRAVVEASVDGDHGPAVLERLALAAAREAVTAHGLEGESLRLTVVTPGGLHHRRCAPVRIEVSLPVPAIALPRITTGGPRRVSSTYGEVVDPFRSGLSAEKGLDQPADEGNPCGF